MPNAIRAFGKKWIKEIGTPGTFEAREEILIQAGGERRITKKALCHNFGKQQRIL